MMLVEARASQAWRAEGKRERESSCQNPSTSGNFIALTTPYQQELS